MKNSRAEEVVELVLIPLWARQFSALRHHLMKGFKHSIERSHLKGELERRLGHDVQLAVAVKPEELDRLCRVCCLRGVCEYKSVCEKLQRATDAK